MAMTMKSDPINEGLNQCRSALECGEKGKPFSICSGLADYTTRLLKAKKLKAAAACFNNMANAYNNTDSHAMKAAIENVFLYRIGNFIFLSAEERQKYMELLPQPFRRLLLRQMVPFGI